MNTLRLMNKDYSEQMT